MRGDGGESELDADLDFFGVPEDARPKKAGPLAVFESNWDTVQLFLRVQTQWMVSPMGQRLGVNYAALESAARIMGIDLTPERFADFQLMEITVINEGLSSGNR